VNRQDRRASDSSVRRTGQVSPALLEANLRKLAAEHQQVRNVLMAILKQQGRVRIEKATLDKLEEGDMIESRELPDAIVFEYKGSDMVVPGGVENGKGKPKGAA
jgi:hypothetical protein